MLVFWLVVLFASFGLRAPPNSMSVTVIGLCALSLSAAVFVILDMDRPYEGLFGMKISHDDGHQCYMEFGATHLISRNARAGATTPRVDHVAYTIDPWDRTAVEAELKRRGLNPRPDEETSFHVKDPDGFDLQICSKEMKP